MQLIPLNRSMQLLQSQLLVNKFIMSSMLSIQNLFNMLNMLNPMVSPKGQLQGQFPSELFANLLQSDLDHLNNQCADLKLHHSTCSDLLNNLSDFLKLHDQFEDFTTTSPIEHLVVVLNLPILITSEDQTSTRSQEPQQKLQHQQ